MDDDAPFGMPGMVAKFVASGVRYEDLLVQAEAAFIQFFSDREWAFVGAQIEPSEYEQSFSGDRALGWTGTFYAVSTDTEESSDD